MAIKELNGVVRANYNINASLQSTAANAVHAGMCVTLDNTNAAAPVLRLADRSNTAPVDFFLGLAADDASRINNQFIDADPVGSNNLSQDGNGNWTVFNAGNNAWQAGAKRAIGEFQDETVTTVTNRTAGASGYQGPGRGVGVFTTPSGQFVVDSSAYVAAATSSATADSGSAYAFIPGDLLTFGAGANKGKLIALAKDGSSNPITSHGTAVARVDRYDAAAGLLYITQLAV